MQKITANQQIKMMQDLKQSAAAWLIGTNASTLRDWPMTRSAAGGYDARDLVAAVRKRNVIEPLDDDDLIERILVVSEYAAGLDPVTLVALVELLQDLQTAHGDEGILAALRLILSDLSHTIKLARRDAQPIDEDTAVRQFLERLRHERARDEMHIQLRDSTGKLRRGRRWENRKPTPGYVVIQGK